MPKIIAPKPYNIAAIGASIDNGLLTAGAIAKTEFFAFTATWQSDNSPVWVEEGPKTERGARVWRYSTESTPMVWIDDGTPEHPITATRRDTLKFQTGFMPKTKPGQVFSTMGGKFGEWRSPVTVVNPGVAARNISKEIGEKTAGPKVPKFIDAGMKGKV